MARKKQDPIPPLEWAAAGLGLVLALLLIAIIGREALAGRHDPVPVLVAEVEQIVATRAGHVVRFRVRNLSGQTAAAVQVEGKLTAGADEETSIATVDYVPGRSQAAGGLIFSADPGSGELELRVTGFELP